MPLSTLTWFFIPKYFWLCFFGVSHLWIPLFLPVIPLWRGVDDGGISWRMDPEHPFRLGWFSLPCLGVGIGRPYDGIQIFPWNELFQLGQKRLPPCRLPVLF